MSCFKWEVGDRVKNRQGEIFEVVSIHFSAVMLSRSHIAVTATQAVLQELGYRWIRATPEPQLQ